jgi:hypothetical protein
VREGGGDRKETNQAVAAILFYGFLELNDISRASSPFREKEKDGGTGKKRGKYEKQMDNRGHIDI